MRFDAVSLERRFSMTKMSLAERLLPMIQPFGGCVFSNSRLRL